MSSSQYQFIASANADLDVIWESIAKDNAETAARVIDAIYRQVQMLAKYPRAGHLREDLTSRKDLLFSSAGNYLIVYQARRETVLVLAVLHAARDVPKILRHRKIAQ